MRIFYSLFRNQKPNAQDQSSNQEPHKEQQYVRQYQEQHRQSPTYSSNRLDIEINLNQLTWINFYTVLFSWRLFFVTWNWQRRFFSRSSCSVILEMKRKTY